MIQPSGNYGAPLLALLVVASLPGIAALRGSHGADPCRAPDALKATSLIPGTTALGERLESFTAATFQWSEGEVANPVFEDQPLQFQIIRSYDGAYLYERPTQFAGDKLEPEHASVRDLDASGERLPIHIVWDHTVSPSRLVAYFFVFDNRPVRSPLFAQLRHAVGLAVGGPRPTTLVLLSGTATPATAERAERAAVDWLARAWPFVAEACGE